MLEQPASRPLRVTWIASRADLPQTIRVVRDLAEHLARRGHACTVAYALPRRSSIPVPRVLASAAARRCTPPAELHELATTSVETIAVCEPRIHARHVPDADVVIGTWWPTLEWIARWPDAKGAPAHLVQRHEPFDADVARRAAAYRLPVLKLAVSTSLRELMRSAYGDPHALWIPSGIAPAHFDAPARTRSDPPTLGYAAGPGRRAGLALDAIRLARAYVPELRVLAVAGQEPSRRQLAALYRSCDLWLVPSDSGASSLHGLEAAACRCPVIADGASGAEDYVRDGESGYLVPRGDARAMASRIVDLLCSDAATWRRTSDASHRIAQRFSWERSAVVLEDALLSYVDCSRAPTQLGGSRRQARALNAAG